MKSLSIAMLSVAVVCLSFVDTAEAQLRALGRGGRAALPGGGNVTRATAIVNPPGPFNRTVARSSVRGNAFGGGVAVASAGFPVAVASAGFSPFAVASVQPVAVFAPRVVVAPVAIAAVPVAVAAVPVCSTTFVPRVAVNPLAFASNTVVVGQRFNAFGTVSTANTCGQVFETDVFGNSHFVGNRFGSAGFVQAEQLPATTFVPQAVQLPATTFSRVETRTVFGQ